MGKWVEEGGSEGRDGERGNEGRKKGEGEGGKGGKVWEDEVRGERSELSFPSPSFSPLPPPPLTSPPPLHHSPLVFPIPLP